MTGSNHTGTYKKVCKWTRIYSYKTEYIQTTKRIFVQNGKYYNNIRINQDSKDKIETAKTISNDHR